MKNVFWNFLKTGFRQVALGSILATLCVSIAYALTYNWSDPSTLRNKVAGDTLSSSQWNTLVRNVDNLNERLANAESTIITLSSAAPTGAVMAFNLTMCPTGWSPADGTGGRPDLRGQFVRGMNTFDGGTTVRADGKQDPDCATRTGGCTLKSWQADELKSHTHNAPYETGAGTYANGSNGTYNYIQNAWATSATGGNETRPRNVALLYCVKN